jgi:hypothetical protein
MDDGGHQVALAARFTRNMPRPLSALWKVTRSTNPAKPSAGLA